MKNGIVVLILCASLGACTEDKAALVASQNEDTGDAQQGDSGEEVDPSTYTDTDGDGHFDYDDCADEDPDIYPGAEEIPYDGIDQDCDGEDDDDLDGDGYAGEEAGGDDCDDADSSINPDAFDDKNGVDDDCDGEIDDDYVPVYDTWPVSFGGKDGVAWGSSVDVDADGNVFVLGGFQGEVDFDPVGDDFDERESEGKLSDAYVVKLNSDREEQWVSALLSTGQTTAEEIVVDSEGMLAVVGGYTETVDVADGDPTYQMFAQAGQDAYVVRLDVEGDVLWGVSFSGSGEESANSVAVQDDGVVVVAGQFSADIDLDPGVDEALDLHESIGGGAFVAVLDVSGGFTWGASMHAVEEKSGSAAAHRVVWGSDGTVYVVGEATGSVDLDPGDDQVVPDITGSSAAFVVALDGETGAYLWSTVFTGMDKAAAGATSLDVTTDGTLVVGGWFSGDVILGDDTTVVSAVGGTDAFVVWLDSNGALLGSDAFGGKGDDAIWDLRADADGGVVVGGSFSETVTIGADALASEGGTDNWAAALDGEGNISWAVGFGNTEDEAVMGVCADGAGGGYLTGSFSGTVDFALSGEKTSDERDSDGVLDAYLHRWEHTQ